MITSDEMVATQIVNGRNRHTPWGLILAVTLIALVIVANFVGLASRQIEIARIINANNRLATQASEAGYHNCVVLRAMVEWADELSPLEKPRLWKPGERRYHNARYKAFHRLGVTLRKINGVPCSASLFGQHTVKSDNKRK